tara:strand:+ start:1943 stop:3208 length:1266 start_codon:yes stop_codon:yes gene_type:complete
MGPMNLYFDVRDIFRAPRLALSGKKIWIFIVGNLAGFIAYWVFTYLSLAMSGMALSDAIAKYGLYPCLYGNEAEWYSWVTYFIGIEAWILAIYLACTAVSRVTLKQLKGNDFFSAGDAWSYVHKHWHAVVFSPVAIGLIIAFFIVFAGFFALLSSIPYLGEFLFVVPYVLYFFGSVFTLYTLFVLFVSLVYTSSIVGVYEEDTMGTVFQSYSIAWSQPWRVIAYHIILIPLVLLGLEILSWFWFNAIGFINYVFGCEWFMAGKLSNMASYASSLVCPAWICEMAVCVRNCVAGCLGCSYSLPSLFSTTCAVPTSVMSGTEAIAGVVLAVSYFLIGLSILSYGLSIVSVGETLMFIIFKKKSDDDDLLQRKDEDELEEDMDDEFSFDDDEDEPDSDDAQEESPDDGSNGDDSGDSDNSDSET